MPPEAALEPFLQQLVSELGTDFLIDKGGRCRLELRDDLYCQLEGLPDGRLQISAVIDEVGHGPFQEEVMWAALDYNGALPRTVAAWTPNHDALVLQAYVPAGSPAEVTSAEFDAFLDAALDWKEAVRQGRGFPQLEIAWPDRSTQLQQ